MRVVDDEVETIHLYVVKEEEKRPYAAVPLLCAFLCLVGMVAITWYSALHPAYEHKQVTVLATFLPLKVFTATSQVVPTGSITYPATAAHGILTITNGSVVSQQLPAGLIFNSKQGIEVVTEASVFVPAGNAEGFGMATIPAHLLTSGINMSTLAVDQVLGTSLYVRNLSPFTGGRPAYTVKVVTLQDKQTALDNARSTLTSQRGAYAEMLAYPCTEQTAQKAFLLTVSWGCQFVTYHLPSSMRVTAARLSGKIFFIDVEFIARPERIWVK